MPGYPCSMLGCGKEACAKLDKSTGVMCSDHIKSEYRRFQIEGMRPTAVRNLLFDPESENEHQLSPQLRLNFLSSRLKVAPILAINPAVVEGNSIEANLKLVANVVAAKGGHKKALARNNEDNRKAKEGTIAKALKAVGGSTKAVGGSETTMAVVPGLSEKDIQEAVQVFRVIMKHNDVERDFLMSNKVPVLPGEGGRCEPQSEEAEAKVVHNDRSFLVTASGRAPVRGTGPGQVAIVLVHSLPAFDKAVERSLRKGGPAATMIYMCLSEPTNTDSAREIEKRCQALAKDEKATNRTEDDRYHAGSFSANNPFATACGCIVKDGLQAVKDGTFFLDLSMPEFLESRIRMNYPWARDRKYWRLGLAGTKKQAATERKRARAIEKKEAAAKKKAA